MAVDGAFSRRAAVALVIAGAVTGCVNAPVRRGSETKSPSYPPPAEPAAAPPLARPPAGRVLPVGTGPEGAVADPVTGLVAVGTREPSALALVEGRTGRVARRVPLPGHVRHLQLARPGGPVLVPGENSDSLLTVDLPAGRVSSRVRTGAFPHDATATGNGAVFVANEFGGSVVVVRDAVVTRTFSDHTQPGGVAAVGGVVCVIDVRRNDLTVYDTVALRETGRMPAGGGPTHVVAVRGGRVLVADTRGNALRLFDTTPELRAVGRLDLAGSPYGLAYDAGREWVWVTLTGRNEVVGVEVAGTLRETARLATVRQPNTVAVDRTTGRLFVTGTHGGVLQLIDP